jgi:hypothetical protein
MQRSSRVVTPPLIAGVRSPSQRGAMMVARSRLEAPSAMSDRISKSMETVGSPDSILATRD